MDRTGQTRWLIGLILVVVLAGLASLIEPGWQTGIETLVGLTMGLDLILSANSASRGVCRRDRKFYLRRALVGLVGMAVLHVILSILNAAPGVSLTTLFDPNLLILAPTAALGNLVAARLIALVYPYRPTVRPPNIDLSDPAATAPASPPPN